MDVREIGRDPFGRFDAVGSLGAFERFSSPEHYCAGRQAEVYRDVFARVASVFPKGGRMYLQSDGSKRPETPMPGASR
jgi:cyclopropane-fatty-acyl-phospholipid synthase